jgi:hypothetical protein
MRVDGENGVLLRAPPAVFAFPPNPSPLQIGVNVDVVPDAVTHVLVLVSVSTLALHLI